jgi:predicted alternative tryptophan synthase beta-subunit
MTTAVPTTASSRIIKLGRLDATTVSTGANATTVTLASLLKSDETLGTPMVNIHALKWTNTQAADKITISRNNVVLYYLMGSGKFDLSGYDDATNNTYDIVIDLGTTGTLILELRKMAGFTEPNQQLATN